MMINESLGLSPLNSQRKFNFPLDLSPARAREACYSSPWDVGREKNYHKNIQLPGV